MAIKQLNHDTFPTTRLFFSKTRMYLGTISEGVLYNVLALCKEGRESKKFHLFRICKMRMIPKQNQH